jgi:hypothetical protein
MPDTETSDTLTLYLGSVTTTALAVWERAAPPASSNALAVRPIEDAMLSPKVMFDAEPIVAVLAAILKIGEFWLQSR